MEIKERLKKIKIPEDKTAWRWFVFFLVFLLSVTFYRHISFESNSLDLGSYSQTVWLYSKFKSPLNTVLNPEGLHALGDHFNPILILISPVCWVLSSSWALLFIQALLFASCVFPIYGLLKFHLDEKKYFKYFLFLFFINVVSLNAILFDFHPAVLGAVFCIWIFYFVDIGKLFPALIIYFLLLLTKENLGLWGIFLSLFLILKKETRIWGLVFGILGLSQFVLAEKYIIPHFLGESTYHFKYELLGDSFESVLINIIKNPKLVFEVLFRDGFLIQYVKILLRNPLLIFNPLGLILYIPNIFERFLSSKTQMWNDLFHYGIALSSISIYNSIWGLKNIKYKFPNFASKLFYLFFIIALSFNMFQLLSSDSRLTWLSPNIVGNIRIYKESSELLSQIPDNASVAAQDNYIPHLTTRDEIYKLGEYERADYVVLDQNKGFWPYGKRDYDEIVETIESRYDLVGELNSLKLYKK